MTPTQIQEHWPAIVDTMSEGLVLIGPSGNISLINEALSQMTGYSKDELIGRPCTIFHCDACELVRRKSPTNWCTLFDNPDGRNEHCHCGIVAKNGQVLPVLKNAAVLRDGDGAVLGAVETITNLSELKQRDQRIDELSRRLTGKDDFCGMIGHSAVMQSAFRLMEKAAQSIAPVIIYGESGVGKDLAARAIHNLSSRRRGPFIQLNCAALNESLLESELFGHVKGAFTGAYRYRSGRFEAANGGNFFLDEIGEMPLSLQVKLLRVLETMQVERVGDNQSISVDVRIIAATNRNLIDMVREGAFREDLFFRINVIPIHLPPLRERREDIPPLIDCLLKEIAARSGKRITGLAPESLNLFMNYSWPGNVRELKSALEYAFVVAESGLIRPDHLPGHLLVSPDRPINPTPDRFFESDERTRLIEALRQTDGNKSAAARLLGVSRGTIWNRMNKYGLSTRREIGD